MSGMSRGQRGGGAAASGTWKVAGSFWVSHGSSKVSSEVTHISFLESSLVPAHHHYQYGLPFTGGLSFKASVFKSLDFLCLGCLSRPQSTSVTFLPCHQYTDGD